MFSKFRALPFRKAIELREVMGVAIMKIIEMRVA